REPHRGRVDVDAEDRAREHVATDGGEVASIAEPNTQFRETLERVYEKGPAAAGGVEHRELLDIPPKQRVRVRRDRIAAQQCAGEFAERALESGVGDPRDELERREKRASSPAFGRRHERFERAPEHLRIDRGLRPLDAFFACGETVLREDVVEERAVRVVSKGDGATGAFERRSGEQATIEKRNATEGAGCGGSLCGGCVERSEEERAEHPSFKTAAARHALFELSKQERAIAVQPSLRLEKGEKEKPRGGEEGELAALIVTSGGTRACDSRNRLLERAIEARRERFAAEDLDQPRVDDEVALTGRGGEPTQCLGVAVDHASTIDDQRGDARRAAFTRPSGKGDASGRRLDGENEPEGVGRSRRKPRGELGQEGGERGVALDDEMKRTERTRTGRDARFEHGCGEAESGARIRVER